MSGDLDIDGYTIFRQIISPSQIEYARSTMFNGKVDYKKMIQYIDTVMMGLLTYSLPGWNASYIKFRVSDSNNSGDASVFHRDVIPCNKERINSIGHTCLSYLDSANLQIIPGSHLHGSMNTFDALTSFANRKTISINPGDLLIFKSGLIHRGIFTSHTKHRRLIQVFGVYSSLNELLMEDSRTLHVPEWTTDQSLVKWSKVKPVIEYINFITYMNVANGYGDCYSSEYDYYSSEGVRPRTEKIPDVPFENNYYIVVKPTKLATKDQVKDISYKCLTKPTTYYFVTTTSSLLVLIILIVWLVKRKRK